jgi:hypothetical protein
MVGKYRYLLMIKWTDFFKWNSGVKVRTTALQQGT